jgi:hypothetical protein
MHWMICGIDGEVIEPTVPPADVWATNRRGGPGR